MGYELIGGGGSVIDNTTPLTVNSLTLSGNITTSAWGTNGVRLKGVHATITDTTSAGTVAAAYTNTWGGNTIAANSAVTFTDYFNTYIKAPAAGTNVTFTNGWSLGLEGPMKAPSVTLATGTIATSQPAVNASQTWNAGGVTFTGCSVAITDTASASGSYYFSITRNGSQWFNVQKGTIAAYINYPYLSSGTNAYRGAIFLVEGGVGLGRLNATTAFTYIGADVTNGTTGTVCVASGSGVKGKIGFTATDPFQNEPDIFLCRQAAGIFGVQATTTTGGSFSHAQAVTNISANTDNLVLSATRFQKLNCTSACNLTGIAPPSGSHVDGREIVIINSGTQTLTLKHNTTSTAANRMFASTGADIALAPNQRVVLTYDGTDNGSGAAGFRCTAAS